MNDPEVEARGQAGILENLKIYLAFLLPFVFLTALGGFLYPEHLEISQTFWGIANIEYLFAGFYLNRAVLRRLIEWHPMYNTLENVAKAKIIAFLLWPFVYAKLFIQLAIIKHL